MEGKQGIHIFLGAPIFPKEKGTPGAGTPVEETSENWNRIELYCRDGKLHPTSELREGGAIAGDARICWSKRATGYVCIHSDRLSVNQTRPSSEPSCQNESCSPSETGKEAARQGTEGTGALRSQTVSGRKRLVNRSRELPGDAITEYLDSCFPEGADPGTAEQELSPQTEFLSVWAASQAAILKGLLASECGESPEVQEEETVSGPAPELHTPMRVQNSTPGVVPGAPQPGRSPPEEPHTAEGSEELFSAPGELLPRGEGGIVMEMCSTALLCSQEEPPHQDGDPTVNRRETEERASKPTAPSPPATAPESKKTRTSLSNRKGRRGLRETRGLPGKPALLRSCVDQAQRYKVLACVLNPCHLKEVRVRSGTPAGSAVPLATIVVTDQSGTERKVVLWRAAAFWALTVYPGDLVLLTDVSVKEDQWRGETVLQSTPASKLLNLGQFFNINHERVPGYVDRVTLAELQGYLRERHPHLLSLPSRAPQSPHSIRHTRLGVLRADTLVHALLRVTRISTLTAWDSQSVLCSRALVWDFRCLLVRWGSVSGFLELHSTPWGSCEPLFPDDPRALEFWSWADPECRETDLQTLLSLRHSALVWDFRCLLVRWGSVSGFLELHSTPWGSCEPLFPDDPRALEFWSWADPECRETDLQTLLSLRHSGEDQIHYNHRPNPHSAAFPLFKFTTVKAQQRMIKHSEHMVKHRPAVMTVTDGDSVISVEVPPVLVEQIFLNIPAEQLNKPAGLRKISSSQHLTYEDLSTYNFIPAISSIHVKAEPYLETANGPYLSIIEEPKQRGFRFRYECEGPSHVKNKKTYPTVKIYNHVGYARVEVQLVTHSDPPRVHAHSLVGKQCSEHGVFNNLGILHVTKKGVNEVLTKRLTAERRRQKGADAVITEQEEKEIANEARELGKVMDLNVVRLKFTAYLQDSNGGFTLALKPVISQPIYDSKSPNASNLKISRMDKTSGSATGGDEIFLLCDKVQKDDIEVRFYEDDDNGWEAYGDFAPTDVHKQYAIVFKTPPYRRNRIDRPVTVFLQLKRKKGGDASEPKQFTYHPQIQDKEEVQRKKLKPLPHYQDHYGRGGAGGPPGGFGAGGAGGGGGGGFYPFPHSVNSSFSYNPMGGGYQGGTQMPGAAQRQDSPASSGAPQGGLTPQQQLIQIGKALGVHRTPLHLAVITKQHKIVDFLLKAGADPTPLDRYGNSVLHLATPTGDEQMLRILLSHLKPHSRYLLNTPDYNGLYPLHLAVQKSGGQCLRMLVDAGAEVNAVERKSGCTALHLAVQQDLFALNADVNVCSFGGNTPLHLAASQGSPVLCSMLIAAGAERLVENDEPVCMSSASLSEEDREETQEEESSGGEGAEIAQTHTTRPHSLASNPRKRPPTRGHTPLDLAKNQKVQDILEGKLRRPGKTPTKLKTGTVCPLDSDTLARLSTALSAGEVQWKQLAEKLGMRTLADLYEECPSPCHSLLQGYQVAGGRVECLIDALQALGLNEGVRVLREAGLKDKTHTTEVKVDSGYDSQLTEQLEQEKMDESVPANS
ncbi:UNVERIFIED_CONTAM: hypothetical protein FKN15_024355 [Acipenser sinensis]